MFRYWIVALLFLTALADDDYYEDESGEAEESEEEVDCEEFPGDCLDELTTTIEETTVAPSFSPSIAPTAQETASLPPEIRIMRFDSNFESTIGNREALFLSQCDEFWVNTSIDVACVHVQAGSVLLTLQGTAEKLDMAEAVLKEYGLDLPDFALLQIEENGVGTLTNTNQGDSTITSEVWFYLVIFSCGAVCAAGCAFAGRVKCFDDEKGFIPAQVDAKQISIVHDPFGEVPKRVIIPNNQDHIGVAVRDGSNLRDISPNDGLGKTPQGGALPSTSRGLIMSTSAAEDMDFEDEGVGPTGLIAEDQSGFVYKPFTRPGEPSIVEIDDEQPTSGLIVVNRKPTSGIIPKNRGSVIAEPIQASL